jgi:abortive infection bacteriophage resistance protein
MYIQKHNLCADHSSKKEEKSHPKNQNQVTKPNSMRKFIYIALIALLTAATVTSCTEQEVTPREGGGGGSGNDPKG